MTDDAVVLADGAQHIPACHLPGLFQLQAGVAGPGCAERRKSAACRPARLTTGMLLMLPGVPATLAAVFVSSALAT
ncbi:MAG TPA: hypothetical protein VGF67_23435 [Ktedonobacteraceae bacterium]